MPIVPSLYSPPSFLKNPHWNTIYSSVFRLIKKEKPERRITFETSDQDFFDVDIFNESGTSLVILLYGLESDPSSKYANSIIAHLIQENYAIAMINHRGCSGRPNKLYKTYHSGFTNDLHQFFHSNFVKQYSEISVIGFSLGGNVSLKFAGELSDIDQKKIKNLIAISVPVDLKSSSLELERPENRIYMKRFLDRLRKKLLEKKKHTLEEQKLLDGMKTFYEFDNYYTAPVNNYADAEEYYSVNSSKSFIPKIKISTYILNAKDDPFLGEDCYPIQEAKNNPNVHLEIPSHGGHVGFALFNRHLLHYHEKRILQFLKDSSFIFLILMWFVP